MSGEERRLACTHAHVLRNNPRVQSEMKRGVPTRPFPDSGREGLGTELHKPSHFGM